MNRTNQLDGCADGCEANRINAQTWFDLRPYAEAGDAPESIGPIGMQVCERLGIADVEAAVALPIVAEVLAELRGDPGDLIGGAR